MNARLTVASKWLYLFLAICRQCRQIHKERMEKESVWMKNTKQANEEHDAEKDSRDRYFLKKCVLKVLKTVLSERNF